MASQQRRHHKSKLQLMIKIVVSSLYFGQKIVTEDMQPGMTMNSVYLYCSAFYQSWILQYLCWPILRVSGMQAPSSSVHVISVWHDDVKCRICQPRTWALSFAICDNAVFSSSLLSHQSVCQCCDRHCKMMRASFDTSDIHICRMMDCTRWKLIRGLSSRLRTCFQCPCYQNAALTVFLAEFNFRLGSLLCASFLALSVFSQFAQVQIYFICIRWLQKLLKKLVYDTTVQNKIMYQTDIFSNNLSDKFGNLFPW